MTDYLIEDDELGLGKCLILKSNWTSSYESIINNNQISILRLSFSAGWKDTDIFFADKLTKLKGLEVYSWKINDLTPLYALPSLFYLGVQADIKKKFELKKIHELKVLKIVFNTKVTDLNECINLEHINIVNFPYESFVKISNLTKLKRVQITSKKLISTEGISNFPGIEEIDFHDCKKLTTFSGFGKVDNLTKIQLSNCPGINEFEDIGLALNLETLIVENCGKLKTINHLTNCKKLKRILIIGNTSIEDGDLSVLKTLPNLKEIRISENKHYNLSKDQISKIIS